MKTNELEQIAFTVRVGFGQSWSLSQQVMDIAEVVGVKLLGGSSEQGQLFFECVGPKCGEFKNSCKAAGFIATIQF